MFLSCWAQVLIVLGSGSYRAGLRGPHGGDAVCGGRPGPHTYVFTLPAPSTITPFRPAPLPFLRPSGGHTAEMMCLGATRRRCCVWWVRWTTGATARAATIAAATDAISLPKARQLEQALAQKATTSPLAPASAAPPPSYLSGKRLLPALPVPPPSYLSVYRSREVGQSYLTSVLTTIAATLHAMLLVARVRPQLLLCNGPGTCLPICIAVFTLHVRCMCMGVAWEVHGRCMGGAWEVHGRCMGGAWEVHGRCMGGAWEVHGRCMGGAWEVHGRCMGGAWEVHGRCMGGAWEVHGRCMGGAWEPVPEHRKTEQGVRFMRLIRTQFRNPLPSWWQVLGVQSSSIVFVESVARVAVLGVQSSSIVFVESVARVDHLSLTGRLLHRLGIVDRFFVQWPHLTTSCKGTHYVGRLM
ncbi:unnamed protein product [Closterium sp. NIES-64]|nr:unnamed protein product [Closterium sp. NIES-64]